MGLYPNKKVIVGSVAAGTYTNYGNRLIEKSTLNILGLSADVPRFSVFEKISDELLEFINAHDCLVITGCTTLQDDPGHQVCFDGQFERIKIKTVCAGGAFYCESDESPSLRIARLFNTTVGARDPWTAEFLDRQGVPCRFIGCPTILDSDEQTGWKDNSQGTVLVSSSPEIEIDYVNNFRGRRIRYIKHDARSDGEELSDYSLFDDASICLTGRLHAALPAIARGIRTQFYGRQHWHPDYRDCGWGGVRYSLLQYLGVPFDGRDDYAYPGRQLRALKAHFQDWMNQVFG